jgi:cytochrome c-type biogenesis protein CcsB
VTSVQLAQASNGAIYAAMITLAIAMVAFAVSFAVGRRRPVAMATAVSVSVSVDEPTAGTTAVLTRPADEPVTQDPGRRSANVGMSLTWLAFILLLIGVVLRGVWAGRVPWGNMYEFSITAALAVLAVFLGMSTRRDLRWLGLFVVIAVELTLGLAVTVLYTEAAQLVPALKSYWLIIHVSAAIICSGAFTIAAATATLSILRIRAERKAGDGQVTGWLARVPSGEKLELMTQRIIAFTFPLWTFAVVAGAIWAENAWGRYWGWDPKETWAFITWVVFAAYLHARSTQGWRGTRASLIVIAGWLAFMINYFGVNFLASSLHSYAGVS